MNFDIVTIFPQMFDSYFNESILARAQKEKLIKINIHNLRDYATDKHQTVDDTPYGGGAGMVMKVEPIWRCVQNIKGFQNAKNDLEMTHRPQQAEKSNTTHRTILFSAKGKRYTQRDAERLKKYDRLILICGRYEGVDERVAEHIADEEISIGDYVLTGGEIPAMVLVDSISRLIPGVLGNEKSLLEESHGSIEDVESVEDVGNVESEQNDVVDNAGRQRRYLEYPQYTKPAEFNGWKVPEVLLSGNHREIEKWRKAGKFETKNKN